MSVCYALEERKQNRPHNQKSYLNLTNSEVECI